MPTPLRVLILGTRSTSAKLMLRQLRAAGFDPIGQRAETESEYVARLDAGPDVILADNTAQRMSVARALRLQQERGLDAPFIIVANNVNAARVAGYFKLGATDYLPRTRISHLGEAVERALQKKKERSQTRETLLTSQDYARNIIESSLDMIIAVDRDRKIVEFNRAAEETFGYRREEVLGKKVDMLYADPPVGATISRTTIAQGRSVQEVYNRRKNGEVFPSYLAASILTDARGKPIGLMGISRDLSELKRAEQELERSAKEFSALYEITRDLATQYHLPTLLQTIVERAATLLNAPGGGIYLFDRERGDLHLEAVKGKHNPTMGARLAMGEGLAGRVAQSRQPMIVDEYRDSEFRSPHFKKLPITAVVEVPMLYRGELIGVLAVDEFETTTRRFTQADTRLLDLFAAHAASAVHNATLFEQVRASRERLQVLSNSLIRAQETERRNIARELHDQFGQALTGVQLNSQAIEPFLANDSARAALQENMATIEQVLQQARDLSLNLRPSILDDFGLVAALQWLVNRQSQRARARIDIVADPIEPRLPADLETVCFRVTQEGLTNALRHANARHVFIELKNLGAELQLVIRDDGIGFDVSNAVRRATAGASLGLLGMQERVVLVGGRIDIRSAPGLGTRVHALFPLSPRAGFVERRTRKRGSQ